MKVEWQCLGETEYIFCQPKHWNFHYMVVISSKIFCVLGMYSTEQNIMQKAVGSISNFNPLAKLKSLLYTLYIQKVHVRMVSI